MPNVLSLDIKSSALLIALCYSLVRNIAAADSVALRGSPRGAAARNTEERRRDFDRILKAPPEIEIPIPLNRRLSMKSPSLAWSRSRRLTATDESPGPLTVRRCNVSRSQSTLPSSSYPRIPRRSSSLSASERKSSDGPTTSTSTRTPSLSDSLYQIEVTKKRQSKSPIRRDADCAKNTLNDDPFIDNNPGQVSDIRRNWARKGYRLAPQLVVRWSSGSWISPGPSARFGSNGTLSGSRISAPAPQQPRSEYAKLGEFDSLRPMDLPVAFVNLRATTDQLQIGMGQTSLWATVYVSADVSQTPFPGASSIAPLDVMILLDSLAEPSVNLLTQVTVGSSVLVSHLSHSHDRFALAYIDQNSKHGFEMLLPLGFHPIGAVRSALNIFTTRQRATHQKASLDIGSVIQGASGIFCRSPRAAFCHLFFVSATPPDHLLIPWIDPAIGFHTITPHACLPLDNATSQLGWHISYTVGACDTGPRETHFIRRISRVIRQIRTGINPGCVIDMKLSVAPGDGCQIQSVIEDCRLISLRPGETWSIPVQIRVPAVAAYQYGTQQSSSFYENPFIEEMMTQINTLLCEYSSDELAQHLLTVHVEYQHSLLPVPTTINVESHLTITRQNYKALNDLSSSEEPSIGSFSQGTDFSFSQGSSDSS
ncbi:hypothetical protein N7456_012251 [Penicillium angulare]|uniref:Uncharacterized protein n=1 Tax=Penicillium angulare TaxID=116970 RepID=A0A9W9K0U7_9EURO|nr:hypothetical protein N7456_012251 [Penicillium angulare]